MANQDIISFASPHGGNSVVRPIKIAVSTTFSTAETSWQKGEVCLLAAGGIGAAQAVIADSAGTSIAHNALIHFVPVNSSQGELSLYNIASGAAAIPVLGSFIPVLGEQEFMTRNVFNASDTIIPPTQAMIFNDAFGWYRDNSVTFGPNGRFGIGQDGTGLVVTRVLDANLVDIGLSGAAGVWAVFKAAGE